MPRHFNTAGPNREELHYTVPVLARLPEAMPLVERESWFVLHAPRQSGKTTVMRALAAELTASGRFAALWATCEVAEVYAGDPDQAGRAIVDDIARNASLALPVELAPLLPNGSVPAATRLASYLSTWSRQCPRPVVLLLDEVDALHDRALISVLRQLRSIFAARPSGAPASVALIGLRDVRDYKLTCESDAAPGRLGTSSPFNVKVASLTLQAFSTEDVAALYGQHTAETGQAFTAEAAALAWELTGGQPWLVNALAAEVLDGMGVRGTVQAAHIEAAKERLVQSRATHLDSLADRMRDPRVLAVVGPMLTGESAPMPSPSDVEFCVDLGLLRRGQVGLEIANPIYREILPRELSVHAADALPQTDAVLQRTRWTRPDGGLDIDGIFAAFIEFWREHGEWMVGQQPLPEFAHQIVLMAFLQRLVNGGATIEREYGVGRGRLDVLVRFALERDGYGAVLREERHALELKVWRAGKPNPLAKGLVQLEAYLSRLGLERGWLVIFDAREAGVAEAWEARGRIEDVVTGAGCLVRVVWL